MLEYEAGGKLGGRERWGELLGVRATAVKNDEGLVVGEDERDDEGVKLGG